MKHLILKLIPYKSKTLPLILRISNVLKSILPQKKEVLFAFGGRAYYWKDMGRELFITEPDFKASILKSDSIIKNLGWKSILPHFDENDNDRFLFSELNFFLITAAVQIAIFDCLQRKNIIPKYILGISLGEITGLYAAGGLSQTQVFKVIDSIINTIVSREKKEFTTAYFNMSLETLNELSKQYNEIHPLYELKSNTSMACIHKDEIEQLKLKLSKNNTTFSITGLYMFPYHTDILDFYKNKILNHFNSFEFQPLKYDYFSASLGKIIPKGTILKNDFLFNFQRDPVLAYSTFKAVENTGIKFKTVQIGPDLFGGGELKEILSNNSFTTNLLSTLKDKQEIKIFKKTLKHIKRENSRNNKALSKLSDFDTFLQNFDLYNPHYIENPTPFWNYIRKKGPVNYIPKNNSWLVLGYEDIIEVLNKPEHFSSKTSNFFDKYLLGADPPSHKQMRTILQPLFAQNALRRIEKYTNEKTENLISKLPVNKEFNFVDYFSLPLSRSVSSFFLGLDEQQSEKINTIIGSEVYAINNELRDYFSELIETSIDFDPSSAMFFIKKQVEEGALSLDAASSIARLLWVAGMLTTSILLSNSFYRLMENPSLINELKSSDQLINKFIDECLRLQPPETMLTRLTTQQVKIQDKIIPIDALISMDIRGGNHDQMKFQDPDKIQLTRPTNSHLSFGAGGHVCLGMALAKLEARIAIKSYFGVFKELTPTISRPIIYYPSHHIRGPQKMIVNLNNNQN